MTDAATEIRFACVGDLHVTESAAGEMRHFFAQAAEAADVLLLYGDLTDYGTPQEAKVLAEELGAVRVPIVAVMGNHDHESNAADEVRTILQAAGAHMLDGEAIELHGVGIAGAKGFAGGFGRASLGAWGEPAVKAFVNEASHEAVKLESALAKLRTRHRIAMLHYAPIAATVQGSRPRSSPSWAAAGSKTRCCATPSTSWCTAMPIGARCRVRPSTGCRSTTSHARCCSAASAIALPSAC